MKDRDRLRKVADETVNICQSGRFVLPNGQPVGLTHLIEKAVSQSVLYRPSDFPLTFQTPGGLPTVEVTDETTGAAARRLARDRDVCLLNFASAKKPGGGFLNGARAQEEDLARSSALYFCLREHREYYESNLASDSAFYTDHIIYSPRVPFFRDDQLRLMEEPFLASVLTAPAPNASVVGADRAELKQCAEQRAHKFLQVAAHHEERHLVLGAWGCGVFANNPDDVADALWAALDEMRGAFDSVVFAVYDHSADLANLRAFQARFA